MTEKYRNNEWTHEQSQKNKNHKEAHVEIQQIKTTQTESFLRGLTTDGTLRMQSSVSL